MSLYWEMTEPCAFFCITHWQNMRFVHKIEILFLIYKYTIWVTMTAMNDTGQLLISKILLLVNNSIFGAERVMFRHSMTQVCSRWLFDAIQYSPTAQKTHQRFSCFHGKGWWHGKISHGLFECNQIRFCFDMKPGHLFIVRLTRLT